MEWFYLVAAIILEVSGTTCMKLSHGFTRLWPSVLMVIFYILAFSSLTLSLKRIDIGVAYAIWAGLGTAIIGVIGIVHFNEPAGWLKIVSLGLIIAGVAGLNMAGSPH